FSSKCSSGEAAEKAKRNSKLPSETVVLLVLCVLLTAALIISYRLSVEAARRPLQTLREENEALRKNLSVKDKKCLKCGAGWEPLGGKCYYFNTDKLNWKDSRRSCRDVGGDLVKIDSREEQGFLKGKLGHLMANDEDMFWTGLTDSETEGIFLWVDGSHLNESFWGYNQPDDVSGISPNADCVRMGNTADPDDLKCCSVQDPDGGW
ncbi:type-2 ice-structuring protein, partial [Austrofundulus limnaeus]|uniref:Type-2 ice-structuring protein n=1 Tax=Austrofundulus limnaeus TaxID=52670 RepID=A0A2I4D363_AUSLI